MKIATFGTRVAGVCLLAALAAGCGDEDAAAPTIDQTVHLNQIQVIGTHNSYHIQPRPELFSALVAFDSQFLQIEYTHRPLDQQFEEQDIRQIEIDVFADPNGGLYSKRRVLSVIGEDPSSGLPELDQPGLKVLHIQDVDFETTCLTFVDCLETVKQWSDAHPRHVPIAILVEAKDDAIIDPLNLGFTVPLPFDSEQFDNLDAEIRSVFPPQQLITPDDVRGERDTLEEAVLNDGWPTLGESRGRVMFLLDNGGKRDIYRDGHPSLRGRILFTNSSPGEPDAAFVEQNDPLADPNRIPELVSAGYVVRTRADADTAEGRSGDTTTRDAALASGAQYVSTDYPPGDNPFGTGYLVTLPDGLVARCNPINAPPECISSQLE